MRILFVQDSLGTGGAERSNSLFWYYLREAGHEIKIIVLEHRQVGIEKEILNAGFNVHFLHSGSFISQAREIAVQIKKFNPDIVHSVLVRSTLRVRTAKLYSHFVHVESLVNCTYDPIRLKDDKVNRWSFLFYKNIERFTQQKVDHFIAITHAVKDHYVQYIGIPENKISIIYRGRKSNPFIIERDAYKKSLLNELGIKDSPLIFTHVGRQEFQKAHLVILRAINELPYDIRQRVQFLFLGREGNATAALRDYLTNYPIENIHWLGHRNDVSEILAASDVFIFPSYYEGLGGSLIEAQAAGLPVICSDIDVFKEITLPGFNSLLIEKDNASQMADRIIEMVKNPDKREQFGQHSLERFSQLFNLEKVHTELINCYRRILQ